MKTIISLKYTGIRYCAHVFQIYKIRNILFKMCYEVTVKSSFWKGRFIFSTVCVRHLSCYTVGEVYGDTGGIFKKKTIVHFWIAGFFRVKNHVLVC